MICYMLIMNMPLWITVYLRNKKNPTFFYFQDMRHPTAQSHALHENTLEVIPTGASSEAILDFGGYVWKLTINA